MSVIERLKEFLGSENISEADLSRKTGIQQATLNTMFRGDTKNPGIKTFEAIAIHYPDLNMNWLFRGGEDETMINIEMPPEITDDLREKIEQYMQDRMVFLEKLAENKEEVNKLLSEHVKYEQLLRQKDETIRQMERRIQEGK